MTEPSQTFDIASDEVSTPQVVRTHHPGQDVERVLLAIGAGGVIGLATIVGDLVSAIFLLFILIMGIRGYLLGAMKLASGIFGLLAAIRWADSLSPYLARIPQLTNVSAEWNRIPEPMRKLICLFAAGLMIGVVVMVMIRALAHTLLRSKPHWKWADHCSGAMLGVAEGIVLSAVLLFAALILEPIARQRLEAGGREEAEQFTHAWTNSVLILTKSVRESSIGKVLESLEPLRTRFDKQLQTMTQGANKEKGQDDSFQGNLMRMIEQMRSDRAARSDLSTKTGLDDATLRTLLDSPEFSEALKEVLPNRE